MILVCVLHTSGHHAPEENWVGFEFCLNVPKQSPIVKGKAAKHGLESRDWVDWDQDNPNLMWSKQL